MNKIMPLQDRVLVRRINTEEKTKGGIFIPNNAREKPLEGEVISVGPGKRINGKNEPTSVKPGDRVLFAKYSETEIEVAGEDLLLIREDDILGIID